MKVGDTVVLHYRLTAQDGSELESTFDGEPARITIGSGELPATLERNLAITPFNKRYVYMLQPDEAFGHHDEALIQNIPAAEFPHDISPAIDSLIEFSLPNGTTLSGKVLEKSADSIRIDFNHPLADCPVSFEIEILESIPAPR